MSSPALSCHCVKPNGPCRRALIFWMDGERPEVYYRPEAPMRFQKFSFGSIRIDGTTYEHDVVIDGGQIRKRKKKPSKKPRRGDAE